MILNLFNLVMNYGSCGPLLEKRLPVTAVNQKQLLKMTKVNYKAHYIRHIIVKKFSTQSITNIRNVIVFCVADPRELTIFYINAKLLPIHKLKFKSANAIYSIVKKKKKTLHIYWPHILNSSS